MGGGGYRPQATATGSKVNEEIYRMLALVNIDL